MLFSLFSYAFTWLHFVDISQFLYILLFCLKSEKADVITSTISSSLFKCIGHISMLLGDKGN